MTFLAWRRCELCGHEANEPEVKPSIVKFADRFDHVGKVLERGAYIDAIRCRDVGSCRTRAETAGRAWLVEGRA